MTAAVDFHTTAQAVDEYETQLRKEALENAANSLHQDLMTYLEKETRL